MKGKRPYSFLPWTGSKRQHLGKILPYVPASSEYDRYIEPFLGSGALFIRLQPKRWVVNDINSDCVNVWNNVKDNSESVIEEMLRFRDEFVPLSKDAKTQRHRDLAQSITDLGYGVARAANFMLLKSISFHGYVSRDKHNRYRSVALHPLAAKDGANVVKKARIDNIRAVSKFLCGTHGSITNTDYREVLKTAGEGDFVFLDPPYFEKQIDYGFVYNPGETIDEAFLHELRGVVDQLHDRGALFMMTQADTPDVREAFRGYNFRTFDVYRARRKVYTTELMIFNYDCA